MGLTIYSSAIPNPVNINTQYFGPPATVDGVVRDQYKHRFNETVSLTDEVVFKNNVSILKKAAKSPAPSPCFLEKIKRIQNTQQQLQVLQPARTQKELLTEAVKKVIENDAQLKKDSIVLVSSKKQLAKWQDKATLAEKYTPLIEEHLRRRANNFLFQLANCFGSRLHFAVGKTQNQGESVPKLHAKLDNTLYPICKRNAAHSSGFPNLIAYDGAAWELSLNGGPDPQGIDYLKDSDMYKSQNSTLAMPRSINEGDIAVDGNTHKSPFSLSALQLLNDASKGQIALPKAMQTYFKEFVSHLASLQQAPRDLGVKKVLEIYSEKILELQAEFTSDPNGWIFTQLDLLVGQQHTSETLRAILRLRCEAVKRNMRGQTEILAKVNKLAEKVLADIKKAKQNIRKVKETAPTFFHESFKAVLIDSMRSNEDKLRLRRLFSLNETPSRNTREANLEKTKKEISTIALPAIASLAQEISLDMRSMQREEINHRGDSLIKLRDSKNWSQKTLGENLRKLYPFQPSSQSTICRTETGKRFMSDVLAKQLSETFNVPKELLLPQFFYV